MCHGVFGTCFLVTFGTCDAIFRHYSSDGKFVTVASGKGDPRKDIMVDVFKDRMAWLMKQNGSAIGSIEILIETEDTEDL